MKIKQDKFSQLCQAMRIAPEKSTKGLNYDGADDDIGEIETRVRQFRKKITSEPTFSKNTDYVKLVAQIDKYWQKLFCDPITVYSPDGGAPSCCNPSVPITYWSAFSGILNGAIAKKPATTLWVRCCRRFWLIHHW